MARKEGYDMQIKLLTIGNSGEYAFRVRLAGLAWQCPAAGPRGPHFVDADAPAATLGTARVRCATSGGSASGTCTQRMSQSMVDDAPCGTIRRAPRVEPVAGMSALGCAQIVYGQGPSLAQRGQHASCLRAR